MRNGEKDWVLKSIASRIMEQKKDRHCFVSLKVLRAWNVTRGLHTNLPERKELLKTLFRL